MKGLISSLCFASLVFTGLLCSTSQSLQAQNTVYRLPSRAPKFNMITRDIGPKPGSPSPKENATATYRRTYIKPAHMRMFVRAKCSDKLTSKAVIERAKSSTMSGSSAVQIDWSADIGNKDVQFWMVTVEEKIEVNVDLITKDGKYSVAGKKENKDERWTATRVQVKEAGGRCAQQEKLDEKKVRVAVLNELNARTLAHFRGQNSNQ